MGKVEETMTKKKRKKGRPSLLEIQKRNLKQQQKSSQPDPPSQSNPNSSSFGTTRSTRRNPTLDPKPELASDDDDERRKKKHRLLHGLNSGNSSAPNLVPDWNGDADNPDAALKMRRIGAAAAGSDETDEKVSKATDTRDGSLVESGPTTPLPDKKLLVFILDRLQKKDTYGVFSEPVDPEELPDYHDIIENPMDFGTVRRKLDEGAYASLEQFENDVSLICSNAMQYNAPDTVFFRQARSMQELAKKDFDNLRQESDDSEPQPKVATARRGRPPGKNMKKLLGRSSSERVGPEFSSDATPATGGDNGSWPNTYNLRKISTPDKFHHADASARSSHGLHIGDSYSNWLSEWENEFPASVLKAVLKYGKKPFAVDENRRESYKLSLASEQEPSVLNTLQGEPKQLMAVGVQMEHGYSRSLARFAADLGPRVWTIASKKIECVLPNGVKFGPGWVGEDDISVRQQLLYSVNQKSVSNSVSDEHISRLLPQNTSGPSTISSRPFPKEECMEEPIKGLNSENKLISLNNIVDGGIRPMPNQMQQDPVISHGMNGYTGGFMHSFPPQMGLQRAGTSTGHISLDEAHMPSRMQGGGMAAISNTGGSPMSPELRSERLSGLQSRFPLKPHSAAAAAEGRSHWQGSSVSPDLNMRSFEPGSPSSSKLQIGSPQQPDLALQL